MNMRDPEEVAEELRLKKEARDKLMREREDLFRAAWENYFSTFNFKDTMWTATNFVERAMEEKTCSRPDTGPSCFLEADGHIAEVIEISREGAYEVVRQWIGHRYCGAGRGIPAPKINYDLVKKAGELSGLGDTKEAWTFPEVVLFAKKYEDVYLEDDQRAGFSPSDADQFKQLYDLHRGGSPELKCEQLWGLLSTAHESMVYPTVEDQEYVKSVLEKCDRNKNGLLDSDELLHLVRMLLNDQKKKPREREFDLLRKSGMDLWDCESWYRIYEHACGDQDNIQMHDLRGVFEPLDIKFDKSGVAQLNEWAREVDDNYDGKIDFGEFCCLVHKMYDSNFADIQGKCGVDIRRSRSKSK